MEDKKGVAPDLSNPKCSCIPWLHVPKIVTTYWDLETRNRTMMSAKGRCSFQDGVTRAGALLPCPIVLARRAEAATAPCQGRWNSPAPCSHPSLPAVPSWSGRAGSPITPASCMMLLARRRWSPSTASSYWPSSGCQRDKRGIWLILDSRFSFCFVHVSRWLWFKENEFL